MREIKYRTWDKQENRWADHNQQLSEVPVSASVNPPSILTIGDNRYDLMLFTGLRDKNGKEIYEGDIIIGDSYGEYPLIIKWDDEYSGFYCHDPKGDEEDHLNMKEAVNGKVIGNIYENRELLK
jgi:uncharacterized phage protein (TIGR01671 family)